MQIHKLKCQDIYFDAVERGDKNFEIRRDDRGFQCGDIIELERIDPPLAGGFPALPRRALQRVITYVLQGGKFGLEPGFVALGLRSIDG